MDFADYDAAKLYAYGRQIKRRNLSGPELHASIARFVQLQDRHKSHGGDHKSEDYQNGKSMGAIAPIGRSADEIGRQLGVSGDTIKRTRAVLASDDEDTKAQLPSLSGPRVV
jgi:hypothetical protein